MPEPVFHPRHVDARQRFQAHFGRPADFVASAPGRVNLLGEHTDYNGGFVLPTALPLRTTVALSPRIDRTVIVRSHCLDQQRSYVLGEEQRTRSWIDYVQGVTAAAARTGRSVVGFEAYVESDIPIGAGLSSSAALEVAVLLALRQANAWALDDVELAHLAHWGENELVGAPVGILDPMACLFASPGHALFLDTRSLEHRALRLPPDGELVVIDSGVRHDLAGGEYRERRQECAAAAEALGVAQLRDVDEADPRIAALPQPLARRARHVVSENARVLRAVGALERQDCAALGELFTAAHASMRDDFEITVPEVDVIVERAIAEPDVYGARMTGGGFGGSVVCLVRSGAGMRVAERLACDGASALLPRGGT